MPSVWGHLAKSSLIGFPRGKKNTHRQIKNPTYCTLIKKGLLRKLSDTLRYFTSSLPKAWAPDSVFWQYWKKLCKCWSWGDKRRKENESLLAYLLWKQKYSLLAACMFYLDYKTSYKNESIREIKIKINFKKDFKDPPTNEENCWEMLLVLFIYIITWEHLICTFFLQKRTYRVKIYPCNISIRILFCQKIMQIHSQSNHC